MTHFLTNSTQIDFEFSRREAACQMAKKFKKHNYIKNDVVLIYNQLTLFVCDKVTRLKLQLICIVKL